MKIIVEKKNDVILLSVSGKLDATTSTELETKWNETYEDGIFDTILSLKDLIYVSSAGLRVFLFFAKKINGNKNKLYFAELDYNVKEVFEMSGFYSIFTVCETLEEAMEKIGSSDE